MYVCGIQSVSFVRHAEHGTSERVHLLVRYLGDNTSTFVVKGVHLALCKQADLYTPHVVFLVTKYVIYDVMP